MIDPSRVRMTGPLTSFKASFAAELQRQGYTPNSARLQLQLVAHLSRWLAGEGLAPPDLSPAVVERFFTARRAAGHANHLTSKALGPLLAHLRGLGAAPPQPSAAPEGPVEELLCRYRRYLTVERGLGGPTARGYVDAVRPFLAGRVSPEGLDLERLSAADITAFVVARCPHQARGTAKLTVTALRSLLGFLHLEGVVHRPLAQAVPSVAGWRLAGLPKRLEADQVQRLLASCDRDTANGRRDFAVLTTLARLGLRAGEVATLRLDDIDWRVGEIVVRGKGKRFERLPLPADVGEAIDRLPASRPTGERRGPDGVRAGQGPTPAAQHRRRHPGRGRRWPASRARADPRPPAPPHRGERDASRRRLADRGRSAAAPPPCRDDGDLRQGRPGVPAEHRPPLAGSCPMSPLRAALADYLALRRSLGYKLERAEKLLGQFLAYLEKRGARTITTEQALAWARLPANASPSWLSFRLSAVRGFARYLQTIDPACEMPPAELLPDRSHRATPYLYSEGQIAAVIEAAGTLGTPHRTATLRTLIGLLAVTGMRVGEAIALDRGDVDRAEGLLVIRGAKFGKSRELPLHRSTADALRRHLRRADRPRPAAGTDAVFVSMAGTRLLYRNVQGTFRQLLDRAGFELRSTGCRPRLHDLRHSFAVRTILDAYRDGGQVEGRLAALSTYLGHADPAQTYWYLSAAPELMELAADRLERHLGEYS